MKKFLVVVFFCPPPAGKRRTRVGVSTRARRSMVRRSANLETLPDGQWKANFLCNLGYGDRSQLFPRNPRLEFDEACRVL